MEYHCNRTKFKNIMLFDLSLVDSMTIHQRAIARIGISNKPSAIFEVQLGVVL